MMNFLLSPNDFLHIIIRKIASNHKILDRLLQKYQNEIYHYTRPSQDKEATVAPTKPTLIYDI